MKSTVLLSAFMLSSFIAVTQTPVIEWQRCIGGKNKDQFIDAGVSGQDSGLIICGTTFSCNGAITDYHDNGDIYIAKLNKKGSIEWSKTLGGDSFDQPRQIICEGVNTYMLCQSNSTDGNFFFREKATDMPFIYGVDVYGNTFCDFESNYPGSLLFSTGNTRAEKMFEGGIISKKYILGKTETTDGGVTKKQFLINEMEEHAGTVDYKRLGKAIFTVSSFDNELFDVTDISHNTYSDFYLGGNTGSPNVSFEYENKVEKIKLADFHKTKTSGFHDKVPADIWVIKTTLPPRQPRAKAAAICLGGKNDDQMGRFFPCSFDKFCIVLSSQSTDGDFSMNYGGYDTWVVFVDKELKIVNKINIGTAGNDKFLSALNLENGNQAILYNVDTLSQTDNSAKIKSPAENFYKKAGLKLDIVNETGKKNHLDLDLFDQYASLWSIGNNKIIVAANRNTASGNDVELICIDASSALILWKKTLGGDGEDCIRKIVTSAGGEIYAVGETSSVKIGNLSGTSGNNDFWITKLGFSDADFTKVKFNDKLYADKKQAGENDAGIYTKRVNALITVQADSADKDALQELAQTSEYLADYDLAAKAYSLLARRLNSGGDRQLISKVKAHLVTCNFLLQSQRKGKKEKREEPVIKSLSMQIQNGRLFVSTIDADGQLPGYSLQAGDEIISLNKKLIEGECLTNAKLGKLLAETHDYDYYQIRRLGLASLIDVKMGKRRQEADPVSTTGNNKMGSTVPGTDSDLNANQKMKQDFLRSIVEKVNKDSVLMKNIKTAKKITYALALINKWAKEPVDRNFFLQVDEQLGLVASFVNLLKGRSIDLKTDGYGSISFAGPWVKELSANEYSKNQQTSFDSVAHLQIAKENKIDDNITFIERNNYESFSGEYDYELISTDKPSAFPDLHPGQRRYINGGYMEPLPFIISITGNYITIKSGMFTSSKYYTGESVSQCSGTISNGIAKLTGTSANGSMTTEVTIDFTNPNNIISTSKFICPKCGINQSGETVNSQSRIFKIKK